ncbi:hypothetical protein KR51_00006340 [Rubidibacter lacunae KORDI 51-2]|uniref:Uncharacterized protein n=1 Tax=Rubidibacter lacunae KORDI 51-2 TaxID=582515 RepID=U5DPW9_9CHRO|nr:hypothetical protein KR51_00006340 [Rubidibacter lacunae KORDI 51-2]
MEPTSLHFNNICMSGSRAPYCYAKTSLVGKISISGNIVFGIDAHNTTSNRIPFCYEIDLQCPSSLGDPS